MPLKQFKVSDEMSRKCVLRFQQLVDTFSLTFVVSISLTVYASVPLHAVYASVPLCEQTCHVLEDVMGITFNSVAKRRLLADGKRHGH